MPAAELPALGGAPGTSYLSVALLLIALGAFLIGLYFAVANCPPSPSCQAPPGHGCSEQACATPSPLLLDLGIASVALGSPAVLRRALSSRRAKPAGLPRETLQAMLDARSAAMVWALAYLPLLPLIFQVQYSSWGDLINQVLVGLAVLLAFSSFVLGALSSSNLRRTLRRPSPSVTAGSPPAWLDRWTLKRGETVRRTVSMAFFLSLALSLFWGVVAFPYSGCGNCVTTTDELRSWAAAVGALNIIATGFLFLRSWISFQMLRDLAVRDGGPSVANRTSRSDWTLTAGAALLPFNPLYLIGFVLILSPTPVHAWAYEVLFLPGLAGSILVALGMWGLHRGMLFAQASPP